MVILLVLVLAITVFMAFFIGKNLDFTCSLWLFKTFENRPVSMVVLWSFAAGIIFTVLCILIFKFVKALKSDSTTEISITEDNK